MTKIGRLIEAQAKALAPNPAFQDPGRAVSVVDLNLGRLPGKNPNSGMSGGPRVAHRSAARHLQAYGGEQAMDWVMDCIRFTADTVANADYHFEKPKEPSAEKIPGEPVAPPGPLDDLFKKPNPYQDYIEVMELLVIDLLLVGNAYWMKWRTNEKDQPLAFYRLAPSYVEVEPTPWGIGKYIYDIPNNDKLEIDPREVIHFRLANPDPKNPYYGLGLISGAGRAADLEIAITDGQASYYENATIPSATLESQRRVPRDVFKKIRAQMRARSQGPKQNGELLVLEAGLKLNPLSPNAVDAAYENLSRMSKDRVFSWFRMSPKLVGIETQSHEKLADVQRHFDDRTARPLMNKIQNKITDELTLAWDLAYLLDYEYQLSPEQQATMAGTYAKLPGITGHEIRAFAKLPKLEDAKYDEALSMPINLPGQNGGTGQPGEDPTRTGHPDPNLPGEAGRPPKGENTKQFPAKGAKPKKPSGKALADILDEIMALPEGKADPGVPEGDILYERRTSEIDSAVESLQSALASAALTLEQALIADGGEGKAITAPDAVAKLRNSKAWAQFRKDVEAAYKDSLSKVMSAAAIHNSDLGLTPKQEINYDSLVKQMLKNKESGLSEIVSTFKTQIADTVKNAKSEDGSGDLRAAVKEAVADWSDRNASTIALTEATRGYNIATLEVAKASGSDKVLVSDGTDSDTPCIDANGATWSVDQAMANLVEHPNCRRGFIPVTT